MARAPDLTTARLRLRAPSAGDHGFVAGLLGDQHVRAYLGGPVAPANLPRAVIANLTPGQKGAVWVAVHRQTGEPVGLLSLTPHHDGVETEVSYQLAPAHWHKGLAREAAGAVLTHGLGPMALPQIIAETQRANTRSLRLLRALGMTEIATVERFGQPQAIYST